MPSACEVDIAGVVAMYALQLASGAPSALVDWNNNYGGDREQVRVLPLRQLGQEFLPDITDRDRADPRHRRSGKQNTYGALAGRTPAGPVTFARVSHRRSRTAASAPTSAKGASPTTRCRHSAPAPSWRCRELQKLMRYICRERFRTPRGDERLAYGAACWQRRSRRYLGWEVYRHGEDA